MQRQTELFQAQTSMQVHEAGWKVSGLFANSNRTKRLREWQSPPAKQKLFHRRQPRGHPPSQDQKLSFRRLHGG